MGGEPVDSSSHGRRKRSAGRINLPRQIRCKRWETGMKRIVGGAVAASALVAMLGWSAASLSAPDAASVVKERQATMKRQSADLKSIKQYLDGSADQAAAAKAAGNLLEAAGSLHTLFPKGTGMDEFPGKSGAKPVIWSEPDKFSAAQKTLVE